MYKRQAYEHAIGQLSGSEKCGTIHELAVAPDEAYAGMLDIIDSGEPLAQNYVAVFDDIAIGAMKAFIERGYRAPDDVSMIGFDDLSVGAFSNPPLTTVHVPKHEVGEIAVRRLVGNIRNPKSYTCKTAVSTYFVERQSVREL